MFISRKRFRELESKVEQQAVVICQQAHAIEVLQEVFISATKRRPGKLKPVQRKSDG